MKLIVGLGNPGTQYAATRHNIGFEAVDAIADIYKVSMNKEKFKAVIGEGIISGEKVILMKPITYMNLSGEAVKMCMQWHKILPDDIIIIYDDVSLDIGQLRIRKKGSAGGHNGIKSIIQHLGTDTFPRIKIGVGEKPPGWDLANYVLGRFSEEEMKIICPRLKDVAKAVEVMIEKDIDTAMNEYNMKTRW